MHKRIVGLLPAAAFVSSIVTANWLTTHYGFISVDFGLLGLTASAGTFAAGAALIVRDATQDLLGRLGVLAVIVIGAAVSFLVSAHAIAYASALAVLVAELANYAVYTPLRTKSHYGDRRWSAAVVVASVIGSIIDTTVFLGVAFGASAIVPALAGQLVGKAWATLGYLALGWMVRRALPRQPVYARGA